MFGLSPMHLILILGVLLIVVGPGKLPETGAALGRSVRGFRDAIEGRDAGSVSADTAAGHAGGRTDDKGQ